MGRRVSCCSGSTHAWFLRAGKHSPDHMTQGPNHLQGGLHGAKSFGTNIPLFSAQSPLRNIWCRRASLETEVETTEVNTRLRLRWPKTRARELQNPEQQPGKPELNWTSQKCHRNISETVCQFTSISRTFRAVADGHGGLVSLH